MRYVSFLLIGLLAIGCGKNTSQVAAPAAPAEDEDDNEPRASAQHRLGTPVVFLPDGNFALTNDPSLYELATGKHVWHYEKQQGGGHSIAVSHDGKTALSAGNDGTIKWWDVPTGTERRTLTGHQGEVTCVAFLPDSKQALSG